MDIQGQAKKTNLGGPKTEDSKSNKDTLEENSLALLRKYEAIRPKQKRNLDQFFATIATTVNRAKLLAENNDISGKRIIFLGDDDLTSIAVALINLPTEITVLDIDPEIIRTIKNITGNERLSQIKTIRADLRDPLPKQLYRKFDICFFDPPYTPNGVRLFLNRAIEAGNREAKIYLCFGYSPRARERALAIQELITNMGVQIEAIWPEFNQYQKGAESIGNRSSLYLCRLTPRTKTLDISKFRGQIYTGRKRFS